MQADKRSVLVDVGYKSLQRFFRSELATAPIYSQNGSNRGVPAELMVRSFAQGLAQCGPAARVRLLCRLRSFGVGSICMLCSLHLSIFTHLSGGRPPAFHDPRSGHHLRRYAARRAHIAAGRASGADPAGARKSEGMRDETVMTNVSQLVELAG